MVFPNAAHTNTYTEKKEKERKSTTSRQAIVVNISWLVLQDRRGISKVHTVLPHFLPATNNSNQIIWLRPITEVAV